VSLRTFLILAAVLLSAALLGAVYVLRPELLLPRHDLTITLVDARSGEPASARVQIRSRRFLFRQPDSDLWTHATPQIGPYVHVDGSITTPVPRGNVQVIVTRGLSSTSIDTTFAHTGTHTLELAIDDWIDMRSIGWLGVDPHVHPEHTGGKFYPDASQEHVARIARAEGLDLMFLLSNHEATPRGPVTPPARGTTLVWGEEYRNAFWGHVVVLDAPELVVTEYGATCCAEEQTAWPTIEHSLETHDVPLAIMAHPRTTDDPLDTHLWPGAGYARELPSLATRAERLHGVSIAGGTNGPWIWSLEPWLDGLRLGRRWAAFGESDRALDRFHTEPPGEPRTYGWIGDAEGDPSARWIDAAQHARTFATTGPMITHFSVDGIAIGGTVDAAVGDRLRIQFSVASAAPLDSVRVIGVDGPIHAQAWPDDTTRFATSLSVDVDCDAFFVLDVWGTQRLPGRVYAPRAVSSPIWVRTGTPWDVPEAVRTRARDEMETFWDLSLDARGYASAADSTRAFEHTRRPADTLPTEAFAPAPR